MSEPTAKSGDPIQEAMERGDIEGALRLAEFAATNAPGTGIWFLVFQLRAMLARFKEARSALAEIAKNDPDAKGVVDEFGPCVDAEQQLVLRRTDVRFAGARGGMEAPPAFSMAYVQAAALHASGDAKGAARALAKARTGTPPVRGTVTLTVDEAAPVAFEDLTDSDDLTGPHLLVITSGGPLDVPFTSIHSLELMPPRGYQDVLWIPVVVHARGGRELRGRVPSLYPGSGALREPRIRMGTETAWERDTGYALAYGQRDFRLRLAGNPPGDRLVGIRRIRRIDFTG